MNSGPPAVVSLEPFDSNDTDEEVETGDLDDDFGSYVGAFLGLNCTK